MNEPRPNRKTPVHLPVREPINRSVIVFVTVCTDKRKPILCREKAHRLLTEAYGEADSWRVGRYVVMPDHIHLFCAPAERDHPPLTKWVQYWKGLVSRKWPWPEEQPIWQKSFWDTQLRKAERYDEKWAYVNGNPVRKGLAANPDDWPYQGELNVLEWHD
jgi:REP element-mobilizing transposase RayT